MVRMAVRKGYTPGRVSIVPIGGVGEDVLLPLRDGLEEVLGLEVRQDRDQYISTATSWGLRMWTSRRSWSSSASRPTQRGRHLRQEAGRILRQRRSTSYGPLRTHGASCTSQTAWRDGYKGYGTARCQVKANPFIKPRP